MTSAKKRKGKVAKATGANRAGTRREAIDAEEKFREEWPRTTAVCGEAGVGTQSDGVSDGSTCMHILRRAPHRKRSGGLWELSR